MSLVVAPVDPGLLGEREPSQLGTALPGIVIILVHTFLHVLVGGFVNMTVGS